MQLAEAASEETHHFCVVVVAAFAREDSLSTMRLKEKEKEEKSKVYTCHHFRERRSEGSVTDWSALKEKCSLLN